MVKPCEKAALLTVKRTTFDRMELRFLYPPARFLIPIVDVGV
jgi:hypothetical protein